MNNIELLKMAITNLFRRKARSILAILGVVIGTASIVTMVSIGLGISKNFNDSIKGNFELHMIRIYGVTPKKVEGQKPLKLNDDAIKSIKEINGVTSVTPVKRLSTRIILGDYSGDINLTGMDPEFFEKMNLEFKKGRAFSASEKNKIVVGSQIPIMLEKYKTGEYVNYDPDGNYKDIKLISPKVEITKDPNYKISSQRKRMMSGSGISAGEDGNTPKYEIFRLESVGVISKESFAYDAFTSLKTIDEIIKSNTKAENEASNSGGGQNNQKNLDYEEISIYVDNIEKVEDISTTLRESGYQFYSIMDEIKQTQKMFFMIQAALGGIGAISLIVAAIGITNTMIMSIYERTREIGVMKVIGASLKDIEKLFLSEAAAIGLIGGFIGSIFSLILSFIMNFFFSTSAMSSGLMPGMGMGGPSDQAQSYISYMPWWLIIFGILFSTAIGILAGYIPAKKAMQLSALESLRNE
ncbi:MAG: ABC transporter permease [Peptostreptococcaceae bacterium]|nr:ABC transporter permease [Peptostreptococcaceae bacterium]